MQLNKGINYLLIVSCALIAALSIQLIDLSLHFPLAYAFAIVGFICFVIIKENRLTIYDCGWFFCSIYAFLCILISTVQDSDMSAILVQSFIFIAPFISYLSRLAWYNVSKESIQNFILSLVAITWMVFFINSQEVIVALTSVNARARFHTFISLGLVFVIFAYLISFEIKGWAKYILMLSLILFVLTAGHRSAYVAIFAQLTYLLFAKNNNKIGKRVGILLLSLIVATIIIGFTEGGGLIYDLFKDALAGNDYNSNARIDLTRAVVNDWYAYIWGHGFGEYYIYGLTSRGESVYYALHHNSFITPLYFLGFFPWLVYLIGFLSWILIPVKNDGIMFFLKNAQIGFIVFAYFNLWFEHPWYAMISWLMYGLMISRFLYLQRGMVFKG